MKIYIWDLIFGNCKKGIHKFEEFLVSYIPPQITRLKGNSYGADDVIDSLAKKEYEIRCKHCGVKGEK